MRANWVRLVYEALSLAGTTVCSQSGRLPTLVAGQQIDPIDCGGGFS